MEIRRDPSHTKIERHDTPAGDKKKRGSEADTEPKAREGAPGERRSPEDAEREGGR